MSLNVLRRLCYARDVCRQYTLNNCFKSRQWKFYYTGSRHDPNAQLATAGTIQHLKEELAAWMGVECGYKPLNQTISRTHLLQYLPTKQKELPDRTMSDSFVSALIPLSSDLELQDKYVSFLGHVRVGRLLEDMDIFAVYVAQKHILNPKQPKEKHSPYSLVTALVDKIDFTDYLPKCQPNEDIRLSGHVSWVGTSSMEVVVWLEQKSHGVWRKLTRALFLIAARDPMAQKAAVINPLIATTDEEREILAGGETRKKQRKLEQSQHLTKVIPDAEEQSIIHGLFVRSVDEVSLKSRKLPAGCVWMEDCTLSNIIFSHPEDRNLHHKVFGGFLMRQAMELSWALGYIFSKYRPALKSISNISFNRPVDVSSLIRMHAYVVFTQLQYIQVTVYAECWDSGSGMTATSNTFHFTYEVPDQVPEVFPRSYQDAMMYIDGRRHFYNVMTSNDNVNDYVHAKNTDGTK
ncbi:acyl-coenzyme A thioesterase 9, mitochondrial-like isoform X1 [Photinus pyralis]|nr:acyl-coenzyme A thioesterase 9, mitochondrial-like isoform X1 [Photinus pyralis]